MAAEQRKLLEQLMGADQMVGFGGSSRNQQLSITDPKVCRSYIVGTCPHDLFTNTKQDLGPCPKVHTEGLKTEYENASAHGKAQWGFEYDYMRDLQKYIDDCNRRIDTAQRRLEKTQDEIRQTNNILRQISEVSKSIENGLLEVFILAELGQISTALIEYHKVRTAKHQKETFERDLKALSDTSGPSGHQKLQVCDVCGAYLSRLDNDRRLADHFFGKMHLGYAKMRETLATMQKELKGPPPIRHDEARDHDEAGWGGRSSGGGGRFRGGGRYKGRSGGYRW